MSQDVSRVVGDGHPRRARSTRTRWQLAASYFLTGEEAAFRGFKPKSRVLARRGPWGAFEVVARVH